MNELTCKYPHNPVITSPRYKGGRGLVITDEVNMNQEAISGEEVQSTIKKLKQYKCGGPDLTIVEIFKAMDRTSVEKSAVLCTNGGTRKR